MVYNSIKFVVFLPLLLSAMAYSQDYSLFYLERDVTISSRDELGLDTAFSFLSIEEVVTEADGEAYYFTKQIDTTNINLCPTDTSIAGIKMLKLADDLNGTCVFFNSNGDSIFIRTILGLGDTWRFYTFEDGSYVEASVVTYNEFGILPGIDDSLYRVRLNVFSEFDEPLLDVFPDETKFDISKQYGLTEMWDFYNFPNDQDQYFLSGLTNPKIAVTDIDAEAAFNYQSGYELHYQITEANQDTISTTFQGWFILNSEVRPDNSGVDLEIRETSYFLQEIAGVVTDEFGIIDTIDVGFNYDDYTFLDSLELRMIPEDEYTFSDHIFNENEYMGVRHKVLQAIYNEGLGDQCLETNEERTIARVYGDGIGSLYFLDSISNVDFLRSEVVYFQKGLITWGEPIDFEGLGLVDIELLPLESNEWNIYPNPANNWVRIDGELDYNTTITLFDLNGKLLKQWNGASILDLSDIAPGMYLISIQSDERQSIQSLVIH